MKPMQLRILSMILTQTLFGGLGGLGLLATGCGRGATEVDAGASGSKYVLWGVSDGCLVRKINKPTVTMCLTGQGDVERAKTMTRKAMLDWVEPLRETAESGGIPALASEVEFACGGQVDGTINLQGGDGIATAGPGHVNIFDRSAYGTYLHEFGHAFACIGDTYMNGTAANCQPGQPHSIMCDGLLRNDLTDDDITAVRKQFKTANGLPQ